MDKQPELIVIGYTNIDVNITPSTRTILPGGAAYFVSIAASLATQPVGLVTRIGLDFDTSFLMTRVLRDGIHIITDKKTARSTQTYHSDSDLTQRDISLEWGVAPDICTDDIPATWLSSAKHIHIGTMPPKQQQPFLLYIRKHAPQTTISIDTDIFLLSDSENKKIVEHNFEQADIIFVNRKEYAALIDTVNNHPYAIVKEDKDGAKIIKRGNTVVSISNPSVNPVDVTGAGDILAGIFLGNRTNGVDEKASLQSAVNMATQSITKEGVMHLFD
jgi:sugar/nucleoside kinase (ribokinase family)